MKALAVLEARGTRLTRGSLGVLTHARAAGFDVSAVLAEGGADVAATAGRFGASTVFHSDGVGSDGCGHSGCVDLLARLVHEEGYECVLFSESTHASEVAASLAVRIDAGVNWDLTSIDLGQSGLVGRRSALSDSVEVDVGWIGNPALAVFRAGALDPVEIGGEAELRAVPAPSAGPVIRVDAAPVVESTVALEDAPIVVAGGRGVGSAEGFRLVEELADALGGAVAGTAAAVQAGWCPPSALIGQSGRTVAPRLYVAVGISGAIHHRVGMHRARTIVAVNVDPTAPIFDVAHLGVVGDVQTVLPPLIELVRRTRGHAT